MASSSETVPEAASAALAAAMAGYLSPAPGSTRAGTGQTSYAGAMFAVTALRQGGQWKIENIDTFSG